MRSEQEIREYIDYYSRIDEKFGYDLDDGPVGTAIRAIYAAKIDMLKWVLS